MSTHQRYIVTTVQKHDGQSTGECSISVNYYTTKRKAYQAILDYCKKEGNEILEDYTVTSLMKKYSLGKQILIDHEPVCCCIVHEIEKNTPLCTYINVETDEISDS